jgi:hypothetical protein
VNEKEEPDETPSEKLRVRLLKNQGDIRKKITLFFFYKFHFLNLDLLRSFQANFEFNHDQSNENTTEKRNQIKPLGKININWTVSNTKNISHFILQWRSSKDLHIQQKTIPNNETSTTIG